MKIAAKICLLCGLPVWAMAGCLSTIPAWEGEDAGADGGVLLDAGEPADGGAGQPDAGDPESDGGMPEPDAGTHMDGGAMPSDGGAFANDAGTTDEDGGLEMNVDAGGNAGDAGSAGPDGGAGPEPNCEANQHVENAGDGCVSNTRNCVVENGMGKQTWSGTGWGTCTATTCDSFFHVEQQSCVSDTRMCPIENGTGSQVFASGQWGSCLLMTCNDTYHHELGTCISNTRDCVIDNGTGEQSWVQAGLATGWSDCEVVTCDNGYHEDNEGCASNMRTCVVAHGTGQETWNGTGWGACAVTTCDTGYQESAGICEPVAGATIEGPVGMQFAVIPAGTFTMGSPAAELGRGEGENQHQVTFTYHFAMGKTEVTQAQWKALTGELNPSSFTSCGDDCPVERVDWYATLAYANALSAAAGLQECYTLTPSSCANDISDWGDGATVTAGDDDCTGATFAGLTCTGYRLPTEAEWEYAYRAGTTTAYSNGENTQEYRVPLDPKLDEMAWYGGNSGNVTYTGYPCTSFYTGASSCGTNPVAGKQPNPWGLYDMAGNVWEWTWDAYVAELSATTDGTGPETGPGTGIGNQRVLRGGSWSDGAGRCRAANRSERSGPGNVNHNRGFRLTRTLP